MEMEWKNISSMEYGRKFPVLEWKFPVLEENSSIGMEENFQDGIWKNHLPFHIMPCAPLFLIQGVQKVSSNLNG